MVSSHGIRILGVLWIAGLVLGGLQGCGFEPVYRQGGSSGATSGELGRSLASVSVLRIDDRVGHRIRNHLVQLLGSGSDQGPDSYELSVKVEETRTPLLIQADDTITRFNLSLEARFVLRELDSGKQLLDGRARSIGSYNVVESEFATVMAERDAENRAAGELSAEIHSLLVAYFSRPQG